MSRLQKELHVEARWRSDGTVGLYFPDGKVVELIKEQGLAFMKYEDFWPIRQQLAYSHRRGYHLHIHKQLPHMVHCSQCMASTQTEEDTMRISWTEQKVVEDEPRPPSMA